MIRTRDINFRFLFCRSVIDMEGDSGQERDLSISSASHAQESQCYAGEKKLSITWTKYAKLRVGSSTCRWDKKGLECMIS